MWFRQRERIRFHLESSARQDKCRSTMAESVRNEALDCGWTYAGVGLVLVIVLLLSVSNARADEINLGVLSYEGFIPGVSGGPGTLAVAIDNLTGLPPDFYSDPIDFTDVTLALLLSDNSVLGCNVGTVSFEGANTECQIARNRLPRVHPRNRQHSGHHVTRWASV